MTRPPGAGLDQVLEHARRGATVPGIAARLGLPQDLAAAMVDELDRLGLLQVGRRAGASCGAGCGSPTGAADGGCAPALPPTCAGCPLAHRGATR